MTSATFEIGCLYKLIVKSSFWLNGIHWVDKNSVLLFLYSKDLESFDNSITGKDYYFLYDNKILSKYLEPGHYNIVLGRTNV